MDLMLMTHSNILVYQMGKVGSVSVQVALRQKGLRTTHAHWMNNEEGEFPTSKASLVKEIQEGKRGKWKVITTVREPMARNISAFFQRIEDYWPTYRTYKYDPKMVNAFIDKYNHRWPHIWFQTELMPVFGIDIFKQFFFPEKGYAIYKVEQGEILVIRLEDLDKLAEKVFKKFLNISGVKMVKTNTGTRNRLAKMYLDFQQYAKFSKDFLDEIYGDIYVQHFYSKNEIEEFKKKWS